MLIKTFGSKKIKIRTISKSDLNKVKKFQDFINSLVKEKAMIKVNKKISRKEEIEWLKAKLKAQKQKKEVILVAEEKDKIVGVAHIKLDWGRQSHIGHFGISIRKGYRKIGLGTYLGKEIIKLAKKRLKPKLKIIRLNVYELNKPAISLYKKLGFEKVAKIPKQVQYQGNLIAEIIMLKDIKKKKIKKL